MDSVLTLKYFPSRGIRKEVEMISPKRWESSASYKYVRNISILLSVKTIGKRLVREIDEESLRNSHMEVEGRETQERSNSEIGR